MFRLVNRRLAANRELESLKQEFNQCSLPIEFVYRIIVSCVDEIMERGLNHPFILKNPYPPSVVSAMITLMADPERRNLFSLKCMRIDTVAGVMLAVLKNLREAIVPLEIQDELTSGSSTPTSGSQSVNKINTVTSLLNHPNFPAVNRALLMELLNLSLAVLNRSSFNRVKPDMLASILGPHIFATQHATILQHTPQQAYSFGWGIALVNDIKRCSKMFYVLLGGYRRKILGPDEWEYDQGLNSVAPTAFGIPASGVPLSGSLSRGQVNQWIGSTPTLHGGMGGDVPDPYDNHNSYLGVKNARKLHQSVPQLCVVTDSSDPLGPRSSQPRYGRARSVSTTLSESIRAAAAKEAQQWNINPSSCKGPAALQHLRETQHCKQYQGPGFSRGSNGSWSSRQQRQQQRQQQPQQRLPTVEQRQQELFQQRFPDDDDNDVGTDELSDAFRRHNIHISDDNVSKEEVDEEGGFGLDRVNDIAKQREQKRLAIEQMIRECRGMGLDFSQRA
ncbi:hypothetical protein BC939DRAFT_533880 [Gamsiella multidivaricata]|uniref:uncharacterized protein n=1 Tax=Gamsiella multidivaricata TaxID=101098 RepID=UPI00221EDD46|nr:uncharacterized protein BC939DRAFT_533880 [Gamsiella multidivaricata]KAI7816033.1 hypothetical protein BC939DRAFT_533880 [Gamsiella multidivaricata]